MAKYTTPEDVAEDKASKKAEKAYNKAMPEADTTYGDLGKGAKRLHRLFQAKLAEKNMPDVDTMGNVTGYAKGGMTASSRADGIAVRGKTRGTIIK